MIELRDSIYRRRLPLASQTLAELSVASGSPIAEFYARYEGPFSSSQTGFCLLDLEKHDILGSILESTKQVQVQFGWPARFLVISDLLADAVYVYDTIDDKVFNVDFEGGDKQLLLGALAPEFDTFEGFLSWYFAGEF